LRDLIGGMLLVVGMMSGAAMAQQAATPAAQAMPHAEIRLWPEGAPGSAGKTAPEVVATNGENARRVSSVNFPSIAPYLVRGAKAPTAAVIVMPGGGHQWLTMDDEGYDVAKYLSGHGVTAFVLKYRLAHEKGSTYTVEGNELDDVQRAIRLVRSRAAEWNVDPERVGVMGFSAGGELAVLASTRWHPTRDDETVTNGAPGIGGGTGGLHPTHRDGTSMDGAPGLSASESVSGYAGDAVDKMSDRPAFEVLMYPGGLTQPPAAGAARPVELKDSIAAKLSKENTPPAFMLCGADDQPAISQGTAELFLAMKRAGISAELHEYAGVGHGFGIRFSQHGGVSEWPEVLVQWMEAKGYLRGQ
jgi:acetyl esterase/lipase